MKSEHVINHLLLYTDEFRTKKKQLLFCRYVPTRALHHEPTNYALDIYQLHKILGENKMKAGKGHPVDLSIITNVGNRPIRRKVY